MKRLLLAMATALWLSACVTPAPQPAATDAQAQALWTQRQDRLTAVSGFVLQGRIATGALPGSSGTLDWQQQGEHFEATFSGALGVGGLRVSGDAATLDVTTKEGHFNREEAEDLLARKLGWVPPWTSLRWWVLGIPEPGMPAAVKLDADGRLASLDQQGWQLDYLEYRATDSYDRPLPRRIDLHREDEKIRVIVDVWQKVDTASP